MQTSSLPIDLDESIAVARLSRDLRQAAQSLGDAEARYLVDAYYTMQDVRIRARGQERSADKLAEPHGILTWFADQAEVMEGQVKAALDRYTQNHVMGEWMRGIFGIGPVIAAGILANIQIERSVTAGQLWQFAGLAGPGAKPWEKGKKRPFNTSLKVLCWKAERSFVMFSTDDRCYYGGIYRQRKEYEVARNEAGEYRAQAEENAKRVGKGTEAYKYNIKGRLSPGHIDSRARRYAVKLFLAHLHEVWYPIVTGKPVPLPYPIAFLGHTHKIDPPQPIR